MPYQQQYPINNNTLTLTLARYAGFRLTQPLTPNPNPHQVSSAARTFSPGACAAAAGPGPPGASTSTSAQTCRFLAIPG
eukprot:scaffold88424_cov38-Phaeocystis_antarctica.AAC.1